MVLIFVSGFGNRSACTIGCLGLVAEGTNFPFYRTIYRDIFIIYVFMIFDFFLICVYHSVPCHASRSVLKFYPKGEWARGMKCHCGAYECCGSFFIGDRRSANVSISVATNEDAMSEHANKCERKVLSFD